jgi:glycerol transport system ATP-binding protein
MNLIEVDAQDGGVGFNGLHLPLSGALAARLPGLATSRLQIGIRPEFVQVSEEPGAGAMQAEAVRVEDLGTYKILTLRLQGHLIKARLPEDQAVPKRKAWVGLPAQWLMLYADDKLVEELP